MNWIERLEYYLWALCVTVGSYALLRCVFELIIYVG